MTTTFEAQHRRLVARGPQRVDHGRTGYRNEEIIGYTRGKLGFEPWHWTDDRGYVAIDARPHLATWIQTAAPTPTTNKEAA